ncbi:MAG: PD-(D/E)XK nuclease family protein [Halobacteriota archaeon]|nr:PD-(D/E)XK nuclease family protein [Halobacteriota archaeon]
MPIYSYSRINTFENCPLQFKYRYIDKIKVDTEGVEAFLGTMVHETLEELYENRMKEREISLDELIDLYKSNWNRRWHGGIEIVKKNFCEANYRDIGERCLRDYFARYAPFDQDRTIALEKRIEVSLVDFRLVGFIDRLSQRGDGVYEIHDYKTSSGLPTQDQVNKDDQLALYQLALADMWDDVSDVDLVWHYLQFDRELRSRRDANALRDLESRYISKIEAIESTTEFEPKESALCNWCGYQSLCPRKKHICEVESLSASEFCENDGVKFVNRYVELDSLIKELKKEKDHLKEDIISYSKQKSVETIMGNSAKIRIKTTLKEKYPSKSSDEERYNSLVNLVKEAGRWEDVSKLDSYALVRIMGEGIWGEGLTRKIKTEYQDTVEESRISVSKIKDRDD